MRSATLTILALALCAGPTARAQDDEPQLRQNFKLFGGGSLYALSKGGRGAEPVVVESQLRLLHGQRGAWGAAGFSRGAAGRYTRIDASLKVAAKPGAEGFGVAFLSTDKYGSAGQAPEVDAWEEPSLARTFAVGFDTSSPRSKHPSRGGGNFYGREEREVSLHWDGVERANRRCAVPFLSGELVSVTIGVRFVLGGAEIDVAIGGKPVYQRWFLAGMQPYESRLAVGGRTGSRSAAVLTIDDVAVRYRDPAPVPREPTTVAAFEISRIDSPDERVKEAAFPEAGVPVGRIVLRWSIGEAPGGWPAGGRLARLWALVGRDERIEIARLVTPFRKSWTWHVDVSDYRPLLTGTARLALQVDIPAGRKGLLSSCRFDCYEGSRAWLPERVASVWRATPALGDTRKPPDKAFAPGGAEPAADGGRAVLRVRTSAHGGAETKPLTLRVHVGDTEHERRIWRDDAGLNPCRPQDGPWKIDRAGWAPGSIVAPWDVVLPAGKSALRLALDNPKLRSRSRRPRLCVTAHVVYYKKATAQRRD